MLIPRMMLALEQVWLGPGRATKDLRFLKNRMGNGGSERVMQLARDTSMYDTVSREETCLARDRRMQDGFYASSLFRLQTRTNWSTR